VGVRSIPPALFIVGLLCFGLPFVAVGCAVDQGVARYEASGFQLAIGEGPFDGSGIHAASELVDLQRELGGRVPFTEPHPWAALALAAVVVGVIAALMDGVAARFVATLMGAGAVVALVLLRQSVIERLDYDPRDVVGIGWRYGYWLALGSIGLATVATILLMARRRTMSADRSHEPP
jgi:hypothetical protein